MNTDQVKQISIILSQKGYELKSRIGKGAFSRVYKVCKDIDYAVKSIFMDLLIQKPHLVDYLQQQIRAMQQIKSQNIVQLVQVIKSIVFQLAKKYILLVMEFCQYGNLLQYQIQTQLKRFTTIHTMEIMQDVLNGLSAIHQKGFVHRDIKSQNILIKKHQKLNKYIYKIADFGFAKKSNQTLMTYCGTNYFMAPQILLGQKYTISVDLWAIGILIYYMLFNQYPFKQLNTVMEIQRKCKNGFKLHQNVRKKQVLEQIYSNNLQTLFQRLFVYDYQKRMTFQQLIRHPLINSQKLKKSTIDVYKSINFSKKFENFQIQEDSEDLSATMVSPNLMFLANLNLIPKNYQFEEEYRKLQFQIEKNIYLQEICHQLSSQKFNSNIFQQKFYQSNKGWHSSILSQNISSSATTAQQTKLNLLYSRGQIDGNNLQNLDIIPNQWINSNKNTDKTYKYFNKPTNTVMPIYRKYISNNSSRISIKNQHKLMYCPIISLIQLKLVIGILHRICLRNLMHIKVHITIK